MRPLLAGFVLWRMLAFSGPLMAANRNVEYPAYEPPRLETMPAQPAAAAPAAAPRESEPAEPAPSAPAQNPDALLSAPVKPAAPRHAEQRVSGAERPAGKAKSYRVWIWQENGDCLWRIAEKVYGDRSKWRLIYLANKDVIKDPNRIYPKQRLKIPPVDWQP
ncbi:MAG TPA: LysM peptidoglycan-binding domain-containing protein [Elusimicrobiota bacterium]|nr:LysM peptidoglycan-binding domain-containing protein [Elusimicrobiota bacterium]